MLPGSLKLSLRIAQLAGAATLVRSIAYDRWITVLASVLLLLGASAALRGRAWGVALAFGQAVAFPVAWLIGIAPSWFCLVGLAGALPFALTSGAFARRDRAATAILGVTAASVGALGAILWKQFALSAFHAFPILRPSLDPQHGLFLTALALATAIFVRPRRRPGDEAEAALRWRVAAPVQVADPTEREALEEVEAELEGSASPRGRRAGR